MEAKMIKQFLKHKCNSKIKLFIAVICMFALVMSVSGCGTAIRGVTIQIQRKAPLQPIRSTGVNLTGVAMNIHLFCQIRKSGMSANIWLMTVENAVRLLLIILIWKAQNSMLNRWRKQVFLP